MVLAFAVNGYGPLEEHKKAISVECRASEVERNNVTFESEIGGLPRFLYAYAITV